MSVIVVLLMERSGGLILHVDNLLSDLAEFLAKARFIFHFQIEVFLYYFQGSRVPMFNFVYRIYGTWIATKSFPNSFA